MNIALWIDQVLLAALFGLAGFLHGYQIQRAKAQLPWAKDMPVALLRFVGTSEILLAMFTVHIPRKEYAAIPVNSVLMVLSLFVAIGRWSLFS